MAKLFKNKEELALTVDFFMKYIVAVDQGTTSTRAILFNEQFQVVQQAQLPLRQFFPKNGWVEHDAEEIWQATVQVIKTVIAQIDAKTILGMGISNQRETTVIWDRETGKPVYHAIVWQDRRTADYCQSLLSYEVVVKEKTGLLLDPYFSASKINWLLNHIPNGYDLARSGKLAFGTIDSFLLWRLTGGKVHATDVTNAARTSLFNIYTQEWDSDLLKIFDIPIELLPVVKENCVHFGDTIFDLFKCAIPILALAGDQQAALVGQCCFLPGTVKATYGTGCFMLAHTGSEPIKSQHRLLTTIGYKIQGELAYALEGSIFAAGSVVQWLRDQMRFIAQASDSEKVAAQLQDNGGVYLVPAFTGLGAPYWDPLARGLITGLTRATDWQYIVRAGLESIAYQSNDLLQAMQQDGAKISVLRVDGGMIQNHWLMQFLANLLQIPIYPAKLSETTALGVAYLVALAVGLFDSLSAISMIQQQSQPFLANGDIANIEKWRNEWREAVARSLRQS